MEKKAVAEVEIVGMGAATVTTMVAAINSIVLRKINAAAMPAEVEDIIAEVMQKLRNECNIAEGEEIPNGLKYVAANMVTDIYKLQNQTAAAPAGAITEVSMGDVSYKFDKAAWQANIETVVYEYKSEIRKFRRLRR